MADNDWLAHFDSLILVTGANGFIGRRVVARLLELGFSRIRCFVRPSADTAILERLASRYPGADLELARGNLISRPDCAEAGSGARIIYHLAAGVSKSYPDCFTNSVLTTRNLLEVAARTDGFVRFVNVSTIAVYTGMGKRWGAPIDEDSEVERRSHRRGEAYVYGKIKQDQIVERHHLQAGVPYVIVRPGVVYGPGKASVMGRVGLDTFGFFAHVGGSNDLPLTYVENCADAIVLCGLKKNIDSHTFNVVDDDLPTCAQFLMQYKRQVRYFPTLRVPYPFLYVFCALWERYSVFSNGQIPAAFNRMRCAAHWKKRRYSNRKLKQMVGWQPRVSTNDAVRTYFDYKKTGKSGW